MVLPLLAAGARVAVSGGARTAASKSAGRGISGARMETTGMRPGVQSSIQNKIINKRFQRSDQEGREEEAEDVNRSPYIQNARAIGSADSRYPTIAETLQQKTAGYSSVARTRDARLQNRKQAAGQTNTGSAMAMPSNLNQPLSRGIKKKATVVSKIKGFVKSTLKIIRVILMVSAIAFPIWLTLQIPLLGVGMLGLGAEVIIEETLGQIPVVGGWVAAIASFGIPGYALFGFSWGLNAVIGLCTLGAAALLLTVFRVPWLHGKWSQIGLCAAMVLYCAPILQMLPWVYLFLFLVWISRVRD